LILNESPVIVKDFERLAGFTIKINRALVFLGSLPAPVIMVFDLLIDEGQDYCGAEIRQVIQGAAADRLPPITTGSSGIIESWFGLRDNEFNLSIDEII
jgi:hypothetical protein